MQVVVFFIIFCMSHENAETHLHSVLIRCSDDVNSTHVSGVLVVEIIVACLLLLVPFFTAGEESYKM